MTAEWGPGDLQQIETVRELEIAAQRVDGSSMRWTPVWVVRVGEGVYVRTWYPRTTGWFGTAVRSGRARIRLPQFEADVVVEALATVTAGLDAHVSRAYRTKYGDAASASMVTSEAEATTVRLRPAEPGRSHP
jgi:hypothetical protein